MTHRRRFWIPWRNERNGRDGDEGGEKEATNGTIDGVDDVGKALQQCQHILPTLFAMLDKNPHIRVLDVGCGSGAIALELARLIPRGQITGVDISGAVLESAKVQAERRGVYNISFTKSDACDLPFEAGTFDVVHTHQAVAHFRDHVKAIEEMRRVTKKGGVICMREADLTTARFGPGYPLLDECFKVIMEVHRLNGSAVDAGRRLKAWCIKAGVPRSSIVETHSPWAYDTLEGRREYGGHWPARCTQGVFAEMTVEIGVKSERLEQYALAWSKWIQDPNASFTMMHGQVIVSV